MFISKNTRKPISPSYKRVKRNACLAVAYFVAKAEAKTYENVEQILQNEPNLRNAKMSTSTYKINRYSNISQYRPSKNEPNSNPIYENPTCHLDCAVRRPLGRAKRNGEICFQAVF